MTNTHPPTTTYKAESVQTPQAPKKPTITIFPYIKWSLPHLRRKQGKRGEKIDRDQKVDNTMALKMKAKKEGPRWK